MKSVRLQRMISMFAATLLFWPKPSVLADGGMLRLSQRVGDWQVSVFTSPEVLRVGPIDISVLIQDAAGVQIQENLPVTVNLECIDQRAIPLEQNATTAAATNKLFQAVLFEVPQAGLWRATIAIGKPATKVSALVDRPADNLSFDLSVSPPLPAWLELAPWVGWPFLIIGMFFAHQCLVARQNHRRSTPSFPVRPLQSAPANGRTQPANT